MLKAIFNWFAGKPLPGTEAPKVSEEAAPYKVETPVVAPTKQPTPATCGCGRSASGLCVGLHKLTAEEWAVHASNPAAKPAKPRKPAAIKAAPKKPAAKKPAAKKPASK